MDLRDLAGLAGEIYARSLPEEADEDQDQVFEDRAVKLETTFDGAGVLHGDLTPECAAVVATVLDALSAPAGAEDTRSQAQRCHDALQEAMRRLVAADLLPERAGQPVKAWVHISLADLMILDGSSALLEEWTSQVRAQWAGHRAAASAGGSDGGAWLDGDAAQAVACDAAMAPFVTGEVNPAALDDLVRLCVQLDRLRHHPRTGPDGTGSGQGAPGQDTARAWEAIERAVIGKAVDLLSGPGGLASFLRCRQLGARLGGQPALGHRLQRDHPRRDPQRRHPPGQALSVGRAVQPARVSLRGPPRQAQEERRQDQHPRLCSIAPVPSPGRDSPVGLDPGPEPHGTTTAWNPDKTKVLHSHDVMVAEGQAGGWRGTRSNVDLGVGDIAKVGVGAWAPPRSSSPPAREPARSGTRPRACSTASSCCRRRRRGSASTRCQARAGQ